jgi:hypothetical protein
MHGYSGITDIGELDLQQPGTAYPQDERVGKELAGM